MGYQYQGEAGDSERMELDIRKQKRTKETYKTA